MLNAMANRVQHPDQTASPVSSFGQSENRESPPVSVSVSPHERLQQEARVVLEVGFRLPPSGPMLASLRVASAFLHLGYTLVVVVGISTAGTSVLNCKCKESESEVESESGGVRKVGCCPQPMPMPFGCFRLPHPSHTHT